MTKFSPADCEPIIALMTRIYMDILDIEEEYHMVAGGDDFRPRIEHFHDAIRAFSSGTGKERLTVERLAYDLQALRYIVARPLSSFKAEDLNGSPAMDVMVIKDDRHSLGKPRPTRETRERLGELYQNYAVLFAALLKPDADRDYHERVDTLNQDVEDLHRLDQALQGLLANKKETKGVMNAIAHLEEDGLREQLQNFMEQNQHLKGDNLTKLTQFLKGHRTSKDKQLKAIDDAHLNYVMAQLGIFENSKDLLKKMAGQGMNLVGKFVENAIADSRREMGR